jgi:hypothetical protein
LRTPFAASCFSVGDGKSSVFMTGPLVIAVLGVLSILASALPR